MSECKSKSLDQTRQLRCCKKFPYCNLQHFFISTVVQERNGVFEWCSQLSESTSIHTRRSLPEVFCWKAFQKKFLFNKVASCQPATLLERDCGTCVFIWILLNWNGCLNTNHAGYDWSSCTDKFLPVVIQKQQRNLLNTEKVLNQMGWAWHYIAYM